MLLDDIKKREAREKRDKTAKKDGTEYFYKQISDDNVQDKILKDVNNILLDEIKKREEREKSEKRNIRNTKPYEDTTEENGVYRLLNDEFTDFEIYSVDHPSTMLAITAWLISLLLGVAHSATEIVALFIGYYLIFKCSFFITWRIWTEKRKKSK